MQPGLDALEVLANVTIAFVAFAATFVFDEEATA